MTDQSEPNELFRAHVTRVGFDLSLGKTHIAALVWIDTAIRTKAFPWTGRVSANNPWRLVVPGMHGLEDRGLMVHHYWDWKAHGLKHPDDPRNHPARHYTITKAGRLVRDLLKEAGIWQEYEAMLPVRPELKAVV